MDLNHFQCFCFPGSISNRINLSNICDGIDLASLLVKIGNGKLHVGLVLLQFWHKNVFYDDLLLGFEWFPPMLFLSSLFFFENSIWPEKRGFLNPSTLWGIGSSDYYCFDWTHQTFICFMSTIGTLKKGVKYVQS